MRALAGPLAAAVLLAGAASPAGAGPERTQPTVVVHVRDTVGIPSACMMLARVRVANTFNIAGVRVTWADRWSPGVLTVIVLGGAAEMAVVRASQAGPTVLGFAPGGGQRAFIFYDRLAVAGGGRVEVALGQAVAHELGHLLLPHQGHSGEGIMRPALVPMGADRFTPTQAQSIRDRLTAQ